MYTETRGSIQADYIFLSSLEFAVSIFSLPNPPGVFHPRRLFAASFIHELHGFYLRLVPRLREQEKGSANTPERRPHPKVRPPARYLAEARGSSNKPSVLTLPPTLCTIVVASS